MRLSGFRLVAMVVRYVRVLLTSVFLQSDHVSRNDADLTLVRNLSVKVIRIINGDEVSTCVYMLRVLLYSACVSRLLRNIYDYHCI